MGRAFTKEERDEVQEKLRRTGLKLLAKDGIRNISIRELTKEVGIAQGGFYNFYKDKEEFVLDLFLLRIREKTQIILSEKEKTVDDPRMFIINLLFQNGMHLKENKAFDNAKSGTIEFFMRYRNSSSDPSRLIYKDLLIEMIEYWELNGWEINCDIDAILDVGTMSGILFSNAGMIDDANFEKIFKTFCEAEVDRFFRSGRNNNKKK
ncbi:MAG: TetR/AcrR family transcriptional regulator [Lachnospiraceae bacterium]|nr:TetR/AcrR family transcriptional regulator [Lachnospiraceae bacterium]